MRRSTLLVTLLITARVLAGQEAAKTAGVAVSGTVHDPSGAALPKTKLKLSNGNDDEARKVTAENGAFIFKDVPPGEYVLRAEATGFETAKTKVKVGSKPVSNIDITLSVAEAAQSVIVSANRKKDEGNINMDRNADQLSFEKDSLQELPTQDQNPLALIGTFASPASQGAEGLNVLVDGVEMVGLTRREDAVRRSGTVHRSTSIDIESACFRMFNHFFRGRPRVDGGCIQRLVAEKRCQLNHLAGVLLQIQSKSVAARRTTYVEIHVEIPCELLCRRI